MNNAPDKLLTFETFLPHVNAKFRLRLDEATAVEMELVEAAHIAGAHSRVPNKNGMVQDVFSLLFDGPEDRVLPQRSYPFEHDKIGRFELFLVPVEKLPGAIRYQVIFNRLVKAG
jgi:hypothetical protein